MSWLGELKDEISNAIHNSLADIIEHALKSGQELLKAGMDNNAQSGGLFANFLNAHPSEFDATLTGSHGGVLWTTMKSLCNDAVVPIAGMIMALIMMYDLLQMIMDQNNFREVDLSIIFRWSVKTVCGLMLVSHIFDMASGFLAFGTWATNKAITKVFALNGTYLTTVADFKIDAADMKIAELLLDIVLSGALLFIIGAMLVVVIIVLASRMIEVFMYLTASPIPVAAMMNRDWGEMGKNWIRNMVALGFQSFFIVVALSIFKTIFSAVITTINADSTHLTMNLILLMGYALALCFTILKSGQISKSVFHAQ